MNELNKRHCTSCTQIYLRHNHFINIYARILFISHRKVLMSTLAASTLTCTIDDPIFTNQFNEFLLSVQTGLPQGSLKNGFSFPVGTALISSNSREGERYVSNENISTKSKPMTMLYVSLGLWLWILAHQDSL